MIENFPALATFAFASMITPGPNNLMMIASGANFGLRRSLPHLFGVMSGFFLMITLVGFGIYAVFETFPVLEDVLKVVATGYMLFLAWKIANAAPPKALETDAKPLTFIQAALFQWVNPKAWALCLSAVSIYGGDRQPITIILIGLTFFTLNFPCLGTWAVMGTQLRRFLTNRLRLRIFNGVMALLLVGSLYPVLAG